MERQQFEIFAKRSACSTIPRSASHHMSVGNYNIEISRVACLRYTVTLAIKYASVSVIYSSKVG